MASMEPCKASFGRVFDDPLGPCHMCAFGAAGARPPPPLSAVLRTSSNASLFPAPQIQSAPGSLNSIPESFFTFSFRMMALSLESLPALPSPFTGRAMKAGPCTYRLFYRVVQHSDPARLLLPGSPPSNKLSRNFHVFCFVHSKEKLSLVWPSRLWHQRAPIFLPHFSFHSSPSLLLPHALAKPSKHFLWFL